TTVTIVTIETFITTETRTIERPGCCLWLVVFPSTIHVRRNNVFVPKQTGMCASARFGASNPGWRHPGYTVISDPGLCAFRPSA
ncbi:hypothetical protein, partial [Prolixibacter bellariivorans]|uniref:hypothetical protein n=1 Tax=Prolixibacter bellariivorans TaxID=314319 RepID=UPI001F31A815